MTPDTLKDLIYLQEHAFNFTLAINPHAPFHNTIAEELPDDQHQYWTSEDARQTAYKTGKYIDGTLYPYGSVSFYTICGIDAAQIITVAAEILREDLKNYEGGKHMESRAFTPIDPPQAKSKLDRSIDKVL